jgi:uncharacterized protein YbjT (DUF2867 family)
MSQNFLITGATGRQGGGVIAALSAMEIKPFTIYALTRNVDSPNAQNLVSKYSNLKLVSGTFDNPTAIFSACKVPISGVFAVQLPPGFPPSAGAEEKQGKDLIDAAIAHGVKVYVQTTVDRGSNSDTNPTKVPHFISKFNIEKHLELQVKESEAKTSFTILRPTSFMENFAGGFMTKLLATSCRDVLPPDQRIQLIAVKDIGWFAAKALTNPDSDNYKNKSINLAGDELSFTEMDAIYSEWTRKAIPTTFSVVRWVLFKLVKEMPTTFDFFREEGFSADIPGLKKVYPELSNFKMWVQQNLKLGQPEP